MNHLHFFVKNLIWEVLFIISKLNSKYMQLMTTKAACSYLVLEAQNGNWSVCICLPICSAEILPVFGADGGNFPQ